MTLAFATWLCPCRPRAAEIARSKKGKIAPREARAESMVDTATCTQSNACGSCNGWNLLTIPVSFSNASLKRLESADYSSQFFLKTVLFPGIC